MRLAITGATGFVGRFVVAEALFAGDCVTAIGPRPPDPGLFATRLAHREHDLAGPAPDLSGLDAVVHAGFWHRPGRYRGGEGDDPEGFVRRNRDGTLRLIEAARRAGLGRFVFLSSRAVYDGYPPGTTLTEDMPARPDTLYGRIKVEIEEALAALSGPGFRTISLRPTGIYGPAAPGKAHKWREMFRQALAGVAPAPRVATELHGRDLADAVRLSLSGRADATPALNLSDLVLDRRDLLALLAAVTDRVVALPERADKSLVSAMDSARARALGWAPGGWRQLYETMPLLVPGG
ncbi:MAG TPA: NAD-dependent dehydratase [Rhodobacteraceae bacterium]|jgi:UDP-glucose 4-epimerase|nr:NAD-dependent dehydratase [Paracoccaceae bacterium]